MPGLAGHGRPVVMAILNVTPDSFSDGGRYWAADRAVARGLSLAAAGADIVDVGGESTRPGAHRVPQVEEMGRVLPVITRLAAAGVTVSIDTMRAAVAGCALDAGASIVNDVSGGLGDPDMAGLIAASGVPYIAMHWRGHSAHMQDLASYRDVVGDVATELRARLEALLAAGAAADQVILDPGLGFAKTADHDWRLLAHLDVLHGLGRPVLIGASRKRFLGSVLARDGGPPRGVHEREDATTAVSALAAAAGVWGIRTHNVRASLDAVAVARAWADAGGWPAHHTPHALIPPGPAKPGSGGSL